MTHPSTNPEVELATCLSQVRRPNHYTSKPPIAVSVDLSASVCRTLHGVAALHQQSLAESKQHARAAPHALRRSQWVQCTRTKEVVRMGIRLLAKSVTLDDLEWPFNQSVRPVRIPT